MNPDASRVRDALIEEFPGGEESYRRWFLDTIGIVGDPVMGRRRIATANIVGERLADGGYGYERAFTKVPMREEMARVARLGRLRARLDDPPSLLDPFAGGGSIPFEARRAGCRAIANELNPVAAAILEGTIVLPWKLGPSFADTIEQYGRKWALRVERRLATFFPKTDGEGIAAYIWAHTVPCPSTGIPTPLAPNFWLASGKSGTAAAVRLITDPVSGTVTQEIVEGAAAAAFGGRATYKGGAGTSIWTDETFSGKYIAEQATAGRMGSMLLAVSITRAGIRGRTFRSPSINDGAAIEAAERELERLIPRLEIEDLVPSEQIPPGNKTDEPRRMGLFRWRDLFTPRQLLAHVTALQELRQIVAEAAAEIGADQAKALSLYLGFALDKAVNFNSVLSSWIAPMTKVRSVFDRHDLSFKWSFAEFDGASALLPWVVDMAVANHEKICALIRTDGMLGAEGTAEVLLGSATSLPIPDSFIDAIVTDPPYYDNVMYGELSDFFLVWLRRVLRDTYPEFCTLALSDKEAEAVANPSLYTGVAPKPARGRRRDPALKTAVDLADDHYERLLTLSFRESHRVLKDNGVLTVMFTHKRVNAWDTLGAALLGAGFSIGSSWPVRTEFVHSLHQAQKNAASSTILLTCTKRQTTTPGYWSDIRGEVASTARAAAARFSADGMVGIDLTLSTFGPVLAVLSRHWPVYTGELGEDGEPQLLRPDVALDLAREEVSRLKIRGLLGGRDVEFDRITDWYLLAWADFAAVEFPAGEALKLSLATHLDLDDLARVHKVIRAKSGTVQLLTPAQRRSVGAVDAAAISYPTSLDALHALMVTYEEDGLGAARAWCERTGKQSDPRFRDLVSATLLAIPRNRERGEFVRPEARTLEGIRQTLFEAIPAPPEPDEVVPASVQAPLFDIGGRDADEELDEDDEPGDD